MDDLSSRAGFYDPISSKATRGRPYEHRLGQDKFLDNEALLEEGKANVLAVLKELEGEGVTVSTGMVANVQTVTRHVLAVQRARGRA
jgi:hypothetical protein